MNEFKEAHKKMFSQTPTSSAHAEYAVVNKKVRKEAVFDIAHSLAQRQAEELEIVELIRDWR